MPNNNPGKQHGPYKMFIISGPSGVGKTTVAKAVLRHLPWLVTTVSYTTRTQRIGKQEDKTMVHVDEETFRDRVNRGEFLEWAVVHGNLYGTDHATVTERLQRHHLLLNIDPQGALQIKRKLPDASILIFLKAESARELVRRINQRQEMNQRELGRRLASAREELRLARHYDYVILNARGKIRDTVAKVTALIQRLAFGNLPPSSHTKTSRPPA